MPNRCSFGHRIIACLSGAWFALRMLVPGIAMLPCPMPDGMAAGMAHHAAPGSAAMAGAAATPSQPSAPQHREPSAPDHERCNCVASCCASVVAPLPAVFHVPTSVAVLRRSVPDRGRQVAVERRSHADHFANGPPASRSLTLG